MDDDRSLEDALLLQDIAVLLASLGLSHVLREQVAEVVGWLREAVTPATVLPLLLVYVPAWAWCAELRSLHRLRTVRGPLLDLAAAVVWTQIWGLLALSVILMAAQAPLNRSLIALFMVVSTLALMALVLAQRYFLLRRRGRAVALVVGNIEAARARELESVRDRELENLPSVEPTELKARLWEGGVDEVVLPAHLSSDRLHELLTACEEIGVPAFVPVVRAELEVAEPTVDPIGQTLYLRYHRRRPDRISLLLKLVLDRSLALLLLVVLAPLMLLIALAIKLSNPGPVLFVQERGGLNGRPFRMLKFRTMVDGAESVRGTLLPLNEMDGPVFKISSDPRITRVGRWLRRTSLDELPQLLNVLVGHMSLVGPRPLPLHETRALIGPHRRRLSVRPGLTCLWQVSGRNELSFEQWMALDLQYVDGWSLGLDFALLLRTLPAMISGRGAH